MNINSSFLPKPLVAFLSLLFIVLTGSAAQAQILLLKINETDPSNVIITATEMGPAQSVSSYDINNGIELVDFFGSNVQGGVDLQTSTSLTTGDQYTANPTTAPIFTEAQSDVNDISNTNINLNLFQNNTDATISFTSGSTALIGTMTLNLTGISLTNDGTMHAIYAGYSGSDSKPVIGEWEVVTAPEPSSWMLIVGSLAVLPLVRRFRRS